MPGVDIAARRRSIVNTCSHIAHSQGLKIEDCPCCGAQPALNEQCVGCAKGSIFLKHQIEGGAKLLLCDQLGPEDGAMLQALYSRSAESAELHLRKVQESGSARFCERYLVGYGHKSIADCGSTTLFIEGVSMLAAKAIQDWPLYSGQETSTRYVDMTQQTCVDPFGTAESAAILERWMDFYRNNLGPVEEHVRQQYPRRAEEQATTHDRAVLARTFDIMRAFLPAGLRTQLSWHTNLRQAGDHLALLVHHPLEEVRQVAEGLRELLRRQYPASGAGMSLPGLSGVAASEGAQEREEWTREMAKAYHYPLLAPLAQYTGTRITLWTHRDPSAIRESLGGGDFFLLTNRPRGALLPHYLNDVIQVGLRGKLDFGSFRDLQRHRAGWYRMPILNTGLGMHPWYLAQLPEAIRDHAEALLRTQVEAIAQLPKDTAARQCYVAMGFRVPVQHTFGLPGLTYLLELRSMRTVHPTLRQLVLDAVCDFRELFPGVALHADESKDDWDVRRGEQTIAERK